MSVCCGCCVLSVLSWSLVQRSPTDCAVSEYGHEALVIGRPWSTRGLSQDGEKYICFLFSCCRINPLAVCKVVGCGFLFASTYSCLVYSSDTASSKLVLRETGSSLWAYLIGRSVNCKLTMHLPSALGLRTLETIYPCTQQAFLLKLKARNYFYFVDLLKTKRDLLYIRNQLVPRCKHFQPQL